MGKALKGDVYMSAVFSVPKKLFTGSGCLSLAENDLYSMGKKALIVTGNHVVKLKCFSKVIELLESHGVSYTIFTGITGEPTDKMITAGVEVYTKEGCDHIIAVGGGSPLDSMKAIAAILANKCLVSELMGKNITGSMPPMAAIPTTAGTGSEATKFTVITDSEKGVKMLLSGSSLIPDIAVVDPLFTVSSPKSVTASTGLDALTHAIESYTSRKAQPLTNTVALDAVRRIFRYLPAAYKDGTDVEAREQMSIAALEAGMAINNASVTLVHGMSRPIGALFHVPHGLSNAMLLEKCISFAIDGAYDKFAELGRSIGAASAEATDKESAEAFVKAIAELCEICEVPTLDSYGIDKEEFLSMTEKMADDAITSGSPANTIKEIGRNDIINIYHSLWK